MALGVLTIQSGGELIESPTQDHVSVSGYLVHPLLPPLSSFWYLHPLQKMGVVLQHHPPPLPHFEHPCPLPLPGRILDHCGLGSAVLVVQYVCC